MMEKIINISLVSFHFLRDPTVLSKWSRIMWVGNLCYDTWIWGGWKMCCIL